MLNLYEIKSNRQFSEVAGQQRKSVAFQTKNDSGLPSSCKALPFGKQILIIGKTARRQAKKTVTLRNHSFVPTPVKPEHGCSRYKLTMLWLHIDHTPDRMHRHLHAIRQDWLSRRRMGREEAVLFRRYLSRRHKRPRENPPGSAPHFFRFSCRKRSENKKEIPESARNAAIQQI